MTFPVKENAATNPVDVRFLRSRAAVANPKLLSHAIEQARRLRGIDRAELHGETLAGVFVITEEILAMKRMVSPAGAGANSPLDQNAYFR